MSVTSSSVGGFVRGYRWFFNSLEWVIKSGRVCTALSIDAAPGRNLSVSDPPTLGRTGHTSLFYVSRPVFAVILVKPE